MAYCTIDDVERYLQPQPTADVAAAITAAQKKIELVTKDIFEPRALTVYTETNRANTAELPYTTLDVTNVFLLPRETEIPFTGWVLENGSRPRLRIYTATPFNLLTVGSEPWIITKLPKLRLKVDGVFGYEEVPFQIREGTALLAAYYLFQAGYGELKDRAIEITSRDADVSSITVEGFSVSYNNQSSIKAKESTGIANLDRFLEPYHRDNRIQAG